jgi:hypothetical protein
MTTDRVLGQIQGQDKRIPPADGECRGYRCNVRLFAAGDNFTRYIHYGTVTI